MPSREDAATTEPGPPKRRAATVEVTMSSSPRAASADEAVARAPSTTALVGSARSACEHARRIADAIPVTSVLKPASTPEEGTTVLTAPTAVASGSIASRSGMIACLQGIVTDRPRKDSSNPEMNSGRLASSCSMRWYSHPTIPRSSHAARWITGDRECSIGEPMTPAHIMTRCRPSGLRCSTP